MKKKRYNFIYFRGFTLGHWHPNPWLVFTLMASGIFDTGLAKVQGGTIRNGFNLHSFNNWG